jgi:hypothetical protein
MKEAAVRKFHRNLGIIVVWFLAGQTFTGLAAAALGLGGASSALMGFLSFLHTGWSPWGDIYRILVGAGTLTLAVSGIMIHFLIRARTHKS